MESENFGGNRRSDDELRNVNFSVTLSKQTDNHA
jgi:hypothetical protein